MITIEQRLLSHTIEDLETGCWNCDYKSKANGYPLMNIRGKSCQVSHIAYQLWVGSILEEKLVCHHCDNKRCINPLHLWLGTYKDNVQDSINKGRWPKGDKHWSRVNPEKLVRGDIHWTHINPEKVARGSKSGAKTHPEKLSRGEEHSKIMLMVSAKGERNNKAKITEREAKEILSYKQQGCRIVDVAKFMKVSNKIVYKIYHGDTWKHLNLT